MEPLAFPNVGSRRHDFPDANVQRCRGYVPEFSSAMIMDSSTAKHIARTVLVSERNRD